MRYRSTVDSLSHLRSVFESTTRGRTVTVSRESLMSLLYDSTLHHLNIEEPSSVTSDEHLHRVYEELNRKTRTPEVVTIPKLALRNLLTDFVEDSVSLDANTKFANA